MNINSTNIIYIIFMEEIHRTKYLNKQIKENKYF